MAGAPKHRWANHGPGRCIYRSNSRLVRCFSASYDQFREGGVADLEGEKKTTVTRIFNESDEGQLFQRIRAQQLDFRKQHALYQHDRLAAVTDDFAEEHVASVLQIANNARGVINDGHIRRAGRRVLSDDAGRRIICLKLRELVRAKTREQLIF